MFPPTPVLLLESIAPVVIRSLAFTTILPPFEPSPVEIKLPVEIAPLLLLSEMFLPELLTFPIVIFPKVLMSTDPVLVIVELVFVNKLAKGVIPPTMPLKEIELLPELRASA